MWIAPILLCGLMAFAIYATNSLHPVPPFEIALGLIVGAICGIPFGIMRGIHTDVRPTERRGVMYLGSSWVTVAIFLVAFGLRFGIRQLMPENSSLSGPIGDGLLAFAIAFIAASYFVIFRKYEAISDGGPSTTALRASAQDDTH
jgi:hypothetical protein